MVIAHRGARAFAPENTLEAIEKAARLGADMVELDVQLTADDQIIVVHDDTLERCSNARDLFPGRCNQFVRSFALEEVQRLDAGSWFVSELGKDPEQRQPFLRSLSQQEAQQFVSGEEFARYESGQVRHPTLREALDRAMQLGLRVNVELKYPSRTIHTHTLSAVQRVLVERTVRLIEERGLCDQVLVSSFDHESLRMVKAIQPAIKTGVLTAQPLPDPVAYCRDAMSAAAYHPGFSESYDAIGFDSDEFKSNGHLPAEPIRSLRNAGIAVNVWTANDRVQMKALMEAGVSGIFTDFPNRLVELLKVDTGGRND